MKNLFLVWAPIDHHYADAKTHFSASLGLVALKTFIEEQFHDDAISVRYIDGIIHDTDDIIRMIKQERPDYVGIGIQLISYKNALRVAGAAKAIGAKTIVGGAQATQLATEIIGRRQGVIDYAVSGDGEMALLGIVQGLRPALIPNITYYSSEQQKVLTNPKLELDLSTLPIPRYDGIDLEYYDSLLRAENFAKNLRRYMRIYSHKGCGYRSSLSGCVFCGRADKGVRYRSPAIYWKEVEFLKSDCQADFLFDVGDDLLHDLEWVRTAVELKQRHYPHLHVPLSVFARADKITDESAALLKSMDVSDVTIGFESGDTAVLKKSGKGGVVPEDNIQAAEILMRHGLDVTASYVLGLPGEDHDSLERTLENAQRVVDLAYKHLGRPPRELVANLLEPSPGSPVFKGIRRAYPARYTGRDDFELEELQRDYFRHFFKLESEDAYWTFRSLLAEYGSRIHALVSFSDAQGWLEGEV